MMGAARIEPAGARRRRLAWGPVVALPAAAIHLAREPRVRDVILVATGAPVRERCVIRHASLTVLAGEDEAAR